MLSVAKGRRKGQGSFAATVEGDVYDHCHTAKTVTMRSGSDTVK